MRPGGSRDPARAERRAETSACLDITLPREPLCWDRQLEMRRGLHRAEAWGEQGGFPEEGSWNGALRNRMGELIDKGGEPVPGCHLRERKAGHLKSQLVGKGEVEGG